MTGLSQLYCAYGQLEYTRVYLPCKTMSAALLGVRALALMDMLLEYLTSNHGSILTTLS